MSKSGKSNGFTRMTIKTQDPVRAQDSSSEVTFASPAEKRNCDIVVLCSGIFTGHDAVRHAFTTRIGGVSTGVFESMNIGVNRGDRPENVRENYRRLARALGFSENDIALTAQVHGDTVRVVEKGGTISEAPPFPCDALITNRPGIALFVFSADCVPILLHDPVARCIGAVHAGWRGTAGGILRKTVEMMRSCYGSVPSDLLAAIGPSIGSCCYEVGPEVYETLGKAYPEIDEYTAMKSGRYYPDLKGLNRLALERCGVPASRISVNRDCTKCDPALFWSHRRDGDKRGLQGAVIFMRCAGV